MTDATDLLKPGERLDYLARENLSIIQIQTTLLLSRRHPLGSFCQGATTPDGQNSGSL